MQQYEANAVALGFTLETELNHQTKIITGLWSTILIYTYVWFYQDIRWPLSSSFSVAVTSELHYGKMLPEHKA